MINRKLYSIFIKRIVANPDNPNKMSKPKFVKLVRNIARTGIYEPLLVRPSKLDKNYYEIINGYHRCHALLKLGRKTAICFLCDVPDEEVNILLATLNRLGGFDDVGKRINLLKSLVKKQTPKELAKMLNATAPQIERTTTLTIEKAKKGKKEACYLNPMVFFVTDKQKKIIEQAMSSLAEQVKDEKTQAAKNTAALIVLVEYFLDHLKK